MLVQQVITHIAERIRAATPVGTRIIAFGSVARGTAGLGIDLDLLVIEPEQVDHYREAGRLPCSGPPAPVRSPAGQGRYQGRPSLEQPSRTRQSGCPLE